VKDAVAVLESSSPPGSWTLTSQTDLWTAALQHWPALVLLAESGGAFLLFT